VQQLYRRGLTWPEKRDTCSASRALGCVAQAELAKAEEAKAQLAEQLVEAQDQGLDLAMKVEKMASIAVQEQTRRDHGGGAAAHRGGQAAAADVAMEMEGKIRVAADEAARLGVRAFHTPLVGPLSTPIPPTLARCYWGLWRLAPASPLWNLGVDFFFGGRGVLTMCAMQ